MTARNSSLVGRALGRVARAWFALTADEQQAAVIVLLLLILGILVRFRHVCFA